MTNAIWANDGIMMFIYSNLKVVLDSSEIVFILNFHISSLAGGEDAYSHDAGRCIGVADGVGSMQFVHYDFSANMSECRNEYFVVFVTLC